MVNVLIFLMTASLVRSHEAITGMKFLYQIIGNIILIRTTNAF